jgi:hypothetical protein
VSKRYGNGTTAAQIAVSRGGTGVELTGPGNSQPHKVAVCPHKTNRSGGVDVHAIKSFSATCAAQQPSVTEVRLASVQPTASVQTIPTSQVSVQAAQVSPTSQAAAAAVSQPQGGVLGVTASQSQPAGGVAGALAQAGNVAGATLPFTGFPLWVAVLTALELIALGLALRRVGRATV